jgi:SRSO17 transposase
VARQYTGTSGKIDNCQLGVFLAYGSARGRALVDRELYLPTSWTEDANRCAAAGVPAEVAFSTKPQLGVEMLTRAHDAGVLAGWVTADEAFGQNRVFRGWLAARGVPFVLATRSDDTLTCPDGRRHQARNLAALAGSDAWERRSAGPGAHGERRYDWTVLTLDPSGLTDGLPTGWGHWLLVRRQINSPPGTIPELAFYRCAGPVNTPVPELVRVAAARWVIEQCFPRPQKTKPDSITARSAATGPGTPTSPWPCSPPPTSPPPAHRRSKRGTHVQARRSDPIE